MKINTDLNILGGLPDWNLINIFLEKKLSILRKSGGVHHFTAIKTDKSVKRFEMAISSTLISFINKDIELLVRNELAGEGISKDSLLLLFWNASYNNDLLDYLNQKVYFLSFYSGRVSIKRDEAVACLKDLRERETGLKQWSDYTLQITASKYLTLLKKFNLLSGTTSKSISHPYLNDKMFILFVYWLKAIEPKSNILDSTWLKYCFSDMSVFTERVMQKKYSKYYELNYTGDKLKIETLIPYETIHHAIN